MSDTETYYEMLWDCAQCNTRGLLGDSHRHCPTCGAAQDAAKRYFPPVGEEIEAKNHQFVGIDWRCAYCDSANSAAAAHCTNCGAGQDGTKPVATVVDTPATPVQPPTPLSQPPRSGGWRWALALLAGVLVALVALGVLFTSTQEVTAHVSGRTWQREIQIEQFGPVSDSAWCDSLPGDAYAVTRSQEQRSTQRLQDGEVCRDERIDKGDGTFVKHRECTPRYREQPVYDMRCKYQVNRWRTYRTVKAGPETAPTPMWPSIGNLSERTTGPGAQRAGARSERYVVSLQSGGKSWSCDVPEALWNKYEEGVSVPVQVRRIGGVDCASLQ